MKIIYSKLLITKIARRVVLVGMSLLIIVGVPIQLYQRVSADQYDDKIAALQQDIEKFNAQAALLAAQSATLQSAIASLQSQAAVIQVQINISQVKHDQLVVQIADTEKQIKDGQDALGKTLANMYVDDQITPLEMLASSQNIGDYLDKQEYRSSVRSQLTSTIVRIKDLKTQLDAKQVEVKSVLERQQLDKAGLVATQVQQQELLAQTQGQETAYQQLVATNQQKVAEINAQQRAYYQSLIDRGGNVDSGTYGSFQYKNWTGNQGCGGGYPWQEVGVYGGYWGCVYPYGYGRGTSLHIDSWQLYNRECVSYGAWALSTRFNKYVGAFGGQGSAYQWPNSASAISHAVRVYEPQPGDAVVLPASGNFAPVGHLMIVESVDGGWMHVSQYNFYGTGEYSEMDVLNSGIILMRFQNK